MAKRKVSGPVKTSRGSGRKTNAEPNLKVKGEVKSQVKTKEGDTKVKERSNVMDDQNTLSKDERVAPAEINQNRERRGRSAKLQAVKKMATMQEDVKRTEGIDENESEEDEDCVSLDLEYDDEEDEDDFEAILPLQKRTSNTRQKTYGKLKSKDKSKQITKEDTTDPVREVEKIYEERYVCQASQEQFLSLSDSDSSSGDEADLSKTKPSTLKRIPDKSKMVSVASDKSKLKEMETEVAGSSLVVSSQPATKSMFDDLDDIPDFQGSQPGNNGSGNQSLFDEAEVEDDQKELIPQVEETDVKSVITSQYFDDDDDLGGAHAEVTPQKKEADVKPVITSPYFDVESDHGELTPREKTVAKPVVTSPVVTSDYFDECSSPDSKHLSKIKNLKRKLLLSDTRSAVKSNNSGESDILEKDESDFEESPPEKAKKHIKKRIVKGKQTTREEEKRNKKQTKKEVDTNVLPATSKKGGHMKSDSNTAKEPVVIPDSRRRGFKGGQPDVKNGCTTGKRATKPEEKKNEKQTKKDVDPNFLPATSKTRGSTKSHSNTSKKLVEKAEGRRRDIEGGQPYGADDITTGKTSDEKKNDKQRKKNVDPNVLPATSKTRGSTKSHSNALNKPVIKTESRRRDVKGGQPNGAEDTTTGKRATKPEEKKNEKQSKKDVGPNVLPVTSKTRGSTKGHSNTTKKPVVKAESRRRDMKDGQSDRAVDTTAGKRATISKEKKNEKQRKKTDNPNDLSANSKKSGSFKSHSETSYTIVAKADGRRGLTQGQPDREDSSENLTKKRKLSTGLKFSSASTVKKGRRGQEDGANEHISSPAKKRKFSTRTKSSSVDTVKRAGREAAKRKKEAKMEIEMKEEDADISSDESEWEEVEDTPMNEIGEPMLTPKKEKDQEVSLEIDIDLPGRSNAGKKKKREYNWANYFQWQVNKYNKEKQLLLHKSHLVLLLSSSFHSNKICNKIELQCFALSIIPFELVSKRPKHLNINYLTKLLGWFKNCFKIKSDLKEDLMTSLERILPPMFEKRHAASERQLVHIFAIILRCLGVDVRLIFSLQPLTFKAKKLTKKFKRENANAPVKKPTGQNAMQEQNEVPQKRLSSSTDILSPTKSAQSSKKPSSSNSSSSDPKTHATTTTLRKSKQQATKSSSSRSSANASLIWSPSKAALMPSKLSPHSSSSTSSAKIPKIQSVPSDTKTESLKSGQPSSKGSSKKSSTNAPKTQITSSKPKPTSSKPDERIGKGSSRKAAKEQKKATQNKPESSLGLKITGNMGKKGREKLEPSSERFPPKRSLRAKNNTRRRMASKMTPQYDERDDKEDESDDDDHSDYEEELRKSVSKRKSRGPSSSGSSKKKAKMSSSVSTIEDISSDDDFEMKVPSVTKQPRKAETIKNENKKKVSRRVLSSDSDESILLVDILDPGSDLWLEVYLSSEKRWVCVDCVRALINKPQMCEKKATEPITYVIGVENDGCMKDITRRYASKWMTETHKLRPVDEWWEETLKPYQSKKDRDRKEDLDVQDNLTSKPLPTSVAEYKNHPLYALKRHLLKFEALYPESAAVIGYCKGEPVYSRECVHTLHTRETWMKEGKAIRINEKPYKMVKPRPKWKKGIGMIKTEETTLGIFGAWQVEDYIPPPAVDGKVPRNEYGNVELFKPTMLPAGTVHLKIAGLNKIARKLDIDCAPAMMGWDFHSGYIHPVMDGFVVCEEHVEVLVAAWEEDRAEQEKREKEKREARAMNHWKLFIKSLLIRERLKERYGKNDPNLDSPSTSQQSEKEGRKDTSPVKASWPENKMTAFTGDEGNLLPFEKKMSKKKKKR